MARTRRAPQEGFVDPAEFFTSIFGGDAFVDWIGEISLMKDLTTTMEITMAGGDADDAEEAEFPGTEEAKRESLKEAAGATGASAAGTSAAGASAAAGTPATTAPPPKVVVEDEQPSAAAAASAAPVASAAAPPPPPPPPPPTGRRRARPRRRPARRARRRRGAPPSPCGRRSWTGRRTRPSPSPTRRSCGGARRKRPASARSSASSWPPYEKERARVRTERVETLARKLLDRVSVWTETDKGADVTAAFREKTRLEVENLKMESFGIDILHAIGQTYVRKATALLKSQRFLGIGGFFSRVRDKGTLVSETWNTISSAIDAQQTMEEMARMEERGGEEWTDEKKVE